MNFWGGGFIKESKGSVSLRLCTRTLDFSSKPQTGEVLSFTFVKITSVKGTLLCLCCENLCPLSFPLSKVRILCKNHHTVKSPLTKVNSNVKSLSHLYVRGAVEKSCFFHSVGNEKGNFCPRCRYLNL